MATITGAKGGGQKQHTPVEQPDSAQSMARCRILLALGEGEFAGGLDATRIFLDGTPLGNADGSMNFENVSWDFRPGTQVQSPIPGFPAVENETSIGVSLTKITPWVRAISNTQIDAVLVRVGITGLQQQENDGDIVGSTVGYHIDVATDGGAYATVMNKTVTEKLSSLYELTHRINLPKANTGWQIRVVRDTADSSSQMLQNKTQVQAITEVIDARLRYPHTALLYVSFNAKSFSNIPKISCKPQGRIIRVPQNYDPVIRTYSGTWNGTFKWAWTNNPAWIWFDVLTEPRFGLGRRVTPDMLDKWELYRIAQRCDQLIPDGKGGAGTEPRFLFDVYIQSQADAWQVVKDIAAGFNGMTFWGNNMFNVVSDMPADTSKLQILTRASVVGKPVYSSGSEKNRYSSALINFSDPDNHYQDRTTAVMFPDLVKQFKFKQTQLTAIGCTRESEAQRRGGWAVYSNSLDRMISVQTGLDGFAYPPGTVFAFADERVSGRVYGGRVMDYDATIKAVITDRGTSAVPGDTLMIRTLGGTVESRTIQAVNGAQLIIATPFVAAPAPNAVFVIDAGQLRLQYFRVTNLTFNDEENTASIAAVEYNASKYDAVDNNARLDTLPISLIPTGLVGQPDNVTVSSYDAVRQGQRVATLLATWDAPLDKNGKPQPDVVAYQAQWKRGDNEWINTPATGLRSMEVPGIFKGDYLVRVRAITSGGASSLWATSLLTHLKGRAGDVPMPVNFRTSSLLWGIQLDWSFPADTADTLQTEVQYSTVATGANPMLLTDVPYPQHSYTQMGLKAGISFWYRARLVDRIGNQSAWTTWLNGQTTSEGGEYLDAIAADLRDTEAFKELNAGFQDLTSDVADMLGEIAGISSGMTDISSDVAGLNTAIEKEVSERESAISGEVTARGNALLMERNERTADITRVDTKITSATENLAQQIAQVSAGTGEQFDPLTIWYFDTDAAGWKTGAGTLPAFNNGWIKSTDTALVSPVVTINGGSYRFLKLRIRKTGPRTDAAFKLEWRQDTETGYLHSVVIDPPVFDANGVSTVEVGDITWGANVKQFRIVSSVAPTATDFIEVDWIAVGRPTPGAGMAALQAESTARSDAIASEASSRETLATQMRGPYTGGDIGQVSTGLLGAERQARVTADSAQVKATQELKATVGDNTASISDQLISNVTNALANNTAFRHQRAQTAHSDASISRIDTTMASDKEALARSLTDISARFDGNEAKIQEESTARADADSATTQQISAMKTTIGGNSSSITNLQKTVTDNKTAMSQSIQQVQASVGTNATAIQSEVTARASADSALGLRIDTVGSTVGTHTSSITSLQKTVSDNEQSTAQDISQVKASAGANATAIQSEATARTSADSALGLRIDTVGSTVGTHAASITNLQKTVSDNAQSTAQSISQVKATADGASSGVQTNAQAIVNANGRVDAIYSLSVVTESNGVRRVSGLVLAADGTQSSMLMSADTFAVYNPSSGGQDLVFAATGGQLFIRDALIQNGSITTLKIADELKSTGWDAGTGWRITKAGEFGIRSGVSGQRVEIDTNGMRVYDGAGTLRVVVGKW